MSKPERVLHIEVGGTYGGSMRALETLLKYAGGDGLEHDVVLCYRTPNSDRLARVAKRMFILHDSSASAPHGLTPCANQRVARVQGRANGAWTVLKSLPMGLKLRGLIAAHSYSAVHINNTFNFFPPAIWAAKLARRPVVAHVRNPVSPTRIARWLAADTACLVTVSDELADHLQRFQIGAQVKCIPDAIEIDRPSAATIANLRREFARPGKLLAVSVGRLDEQKGYDFLLRAIHQIPAETRRATFVLVGDGSLRPRLERLADELGLADDVVFAGFRSDASAITAAADFCVCSSLWEGAPIAVYDAMALERPVISTAVGNVSRFISEGRIGIVVPPRDEGALADGLRKMLTLDERERREIGRRGRHAVQSLTDCEHLSREFSALMKDVAASIRN